MSSAIAPALTAYDQALTTWTQQVAAQGATVEHGLDILRRRDALQVILRENPTPGPLTLKHLHELDQHLRQQVISLLAVLDFPAYRRSLSPPEEYWWWYLDHLRPPHQRDRLNWLYRGGGLALWTVLLGLLGDISRRIFLGGPGLLGFSTIAVSGLLTLLNARSELLTEGKQGFEQLLDHWQVPDHWREEAQLGATAALTLAFMALWGALPLASRYYNERGVDDLYDGRVGSAQANLERAIALDGNNADAHYNLGDLYEELQQFDQAETAYRRAIVGDVPQAYNNLARLYLLPDRADPAAAVALTTQGLTLMEAQEEELQDENELWVLQHSLYKNRGWARLQQGRLEEAATDLQAAIALQMQPPAQAEIRYPATVYCLLAQVQDDQGNPEGAIEFWKTCYELGNPANPDEDTWQFQACQRLQEENLPCPVPSLPVTSP